MKKSVAIVGAGLAGSEAALQLAKRGVSVDLYEMRPAVTTEVHKTSDCAELVCSNSLKSTKPESAAGMLKKELEVLDSALYQIAKKCSVPAGGALAVNRDSFSNFVTEQIKDNPFIELKREEVVDIFELSSLYEVVIAASGPLTSNHFAESLQEVIGSDYLAFFDAAAPIVMADSLDYKKLFRQSRYEDEGLGDYLNAPFTKEEYKIFIEELLGAKRTIVHDFETKELFQACQPIEEIARKGVDAPRFGPLKPVGLKDPVTGKRPWAALQLRAENCEGTAYNLVGFQTNLTFPEQKRVFRLIPGLEEAEFARFGVMHRNTFIDAPQSLDKALRVKAGKKLDQVDSLLFIAGQLGGTEGYCEAIRSGLHCAIGAYAALKGIEAPDLPAETAFGALLTYATDEETCKYQPMHVNFGLMKPLSSPVKNRAERYKAFADRGFNALVSYVDNLKRLDLFKEV